MHILFESQSLLPPHTGVGRYSKTVVREISKHQSITSTKTMISAFPFGNHWNSSMRDIQSQNFRTQIIRNPLPYGTAMKLWSLFNQPKVDRWFPPIDIVHGLAYVLPSYSQAKGILTVHDTSLLDHPEWYPANARDTGKQLLKGVEKADRIIVPSNSVRQNLINRYSNWDSKIQVIHSDVHFTTTTLTPEQKSEVQKELLHFENPYIFWTGEINPRKNVPLLFSLLSKFHKAGHTSLKLVLAGSLGYQSNDILKEAEKYNLRICSETDSSSTHADVLLFGYVSDEQLSQLYACAELFLFPSWDEGFGYPVLEAMSCGTAVVCSCLGSLPELCGDAALLIDPNQDTDNCFECIVKLMENEEKKKEMRQKGYQQCQKFQSNHMINETLRLYEEVYNA